MSKFIAAKAKQERQEARSNYLRCKLWEMVKKIIPRNLPEPEYCGMSVPSYMGDGLTISIHYCPKAEESNDLRRKIANLMAKKGLVAPKWERSVSSYSGSVSYIAKIPFVLPMFKGRELLKGDRNNDTIQVHIENAQLAPGCVLKKVEVVVPQRVEVRYETVCPEGSMSDAA